MKVRKLLENEADLYSFRVELEDGIKAIIKNQLKKAKREKWMMYPEKLDIKFARNGKSIDIIDNYATLEVSNKGRVKILKSTKVYTGNQEDYQRFLVKFLKEIQDDIVDLISE